MSKRQKILLGILLVGVLAVIITTWGSIGSAVLTLALLMALGYLPVRWFLDIRSSDDFEMED